MVLNADRDLYQALVAQQQLLLTEDPQATAGLVKDFAENDQAHERMLSYLKLMSNFPEITSQLNGFVRQTLAGQLLRGADGPPIEGVRKDHPW